MSEHLVNVLTVSQGSTGQGPGILGFLMIAVGIGFALFFLAALFGVLGANIGCGAKILWFFVILALPFLGSLLWFVVGRRTADPRA
ncbi:PLD nuclease N-terminal domain-containing protein [Amycolatopsis sp. NPDC059021]|uniref:PLD nuclease N-terminal domain-containing protein n=1 Tax=Amycolatopsis sp. NPDC059021 TaxID=3346704 RepID=UPI0036717217